MATYPATRPHPLPIPHPAKAVLVLRRITIRSAAIQLGFSELVAGRMLNGYEDPTPRFREGLAEMLGESESVLFRPPGKRGTQ